MIELRQRYELPADVDTVFAAWTSPRSLVAPVTAIEIEPRVGGHLRLFVGSGDNAAVMNGRIEFYDPPNGLRYSWHWGGPEPATTVAVRFLPDNTNTRVDIHHFGFATESALAQHVAGWDSYITGLATLLRG